MTMSLPYIRLFARLALLLVLGVAIGLALAYRDGFDAAALETWLRGIGAAGPPVFMGI